MKKALCLLTAALLLLLAGAVPAPVRAEDGSQPEAAPSANDWISDSNARLKVGNTTPLTGKFFTYVWGGTTSDQDVKDLLHGYSPVIWDHNVGHFRFDRSVVQEAMVMADGDGNQVYMLVLADDLYYSDGSRITAGDYAFSLLLQMDPVVEETGGRAADYSWLVGSDEYLSGESRALSGIRIIDETILEFTVKKEALPYFYELYRLNIRPFPIREIAPGIEVRDDGEGVYLTAPLTAQLLRKTVLDANTGYLSHPKVVSGPYTLESYDGTTARFAINPYYKGNDQGIVPRIGKITYTKAENETMIAKLASGEFDLLNKVTLSDAIYAGISSLQAAPGSLAMDNELRTGLTLVWFTEGGLPAKDEAVRKAIMHCFDRDSFVKDYVGSFGVRVDGFYGLGQWMYRIVSGAAEPPVALPENPTQEEQAAYEETLRQWKSLTLDGMTRYAQDTVRAARLLEEAGWNLDKDGGPFDPGRDTIRYKREGNELIPLRLTIAIPEASDAGEALQAYLCEPLKKAGIALAIRRAGIGTIQTAYEGKAEHGFDMLYFGENFSVVLDPAILAPHSEAAADTNLGKAKEELYALALDMVRTEPNDLLGFVRKWQKLEERISETLPLIPVYSNVYFDFFTRKLHNYRITEAITWSRAIVESFMSDIEETDENHNLSDELAVIESQIDSWGFNP